MLGLVCIAGRPGSGGMQRGRGGGGRQGKNAFDSICADSKKPRVVGKWWTGAGKWVTPLLPALIIALLR